MKAMASDVNQRYISADAMLADLEEFRKNPSINFDYTSADLLVTGEDEPTQVLGANTPHAVRPQPAHGSGSRPQTEAQPHRRPARRDEEEYEDGYREQGSRLPIILAIAAVVVFLAGVGVFIFVSFFSGMGVTGDDLHSVPSLYGMTISEAQALEDVTAGQFQIVQGGTTASELEEGRIVSQNPEDGRNAETGATITVTVSDGSLYNPGGETMPDVYNKDYRLAVNQLEQLGFSQAEGTLIIREEYDDSISENYVISQTPAADTPLEDVEQVELVVSQGPKPEMSTVINFVGMLREDAVRAAEDTLNLVVAEITEEYSADEEAGRITWQSIEQGTSVEEGTSISFRVSLGPDPSAEPTPGPEPSATPEPTPDGGTELVTSSVRVDLPRDGRAQVEVVVTVDGVEQYREVVDTQMQLVTVPVRGSGIQTVTVYIDGVEDWSRAIPFS